MTLIATTVATPLGQMSLLGTADCLYVAAFGDDLDDLRDRLPESLRGERVERGEMSAAAALRDYFAGDVTALDRVDVSQPGGAFHTAVWKEMRAIPAGTTVSYSELAARAGAPRAVRAAASACARGLPFRPLSPRRPPRRQPGRLLLRTGHKAAPPRARTPDGALTAAPEWPVARRIYVDGGRRLAQLGPVPEQACLQRR